jgi:hypothetical protein
MLEEEEMRGEVVVAVPSSGEGRGRCRSGRQVVEGRRWACGSVEAAGGGTWPKHGGREELREEEEDEVGELGGGEAARGGRGGEAARGFGLGFRKRNKEGEEGR